MPLSMHTWGIYSWLVYSSMLLFSIVLLRKGHGLAKSPSVKCRYEEGSCYMFDMEQVLILSRNSSMIACIAWLKMAGETEMPRASANVKERPFANSFSMAWKDSTGRR